VVVLSDPKVGFNRAAGDERVRFRWQRTLRSAASEREGRAWTVVFGAQGDHAQGNDDDTGTTKAERVIEFMRCRTKSCRIEN
jgi:hypothetical protein